MVGTILLDVRLRVPRGRAIFVVLGNLAVPVLQGTSFIDKSVKMFFPCEHKSMAYHSAHVPIIAPIVKTENGKEKGTTEDDKVKRL